MVIIIIVVVVVLLLLLVPILYCLITRNKKETKFGAGHRSGSGDIEIVSQASEIKKKRTMADSDHKTPTPSERDLEVPETDVKIADDSQL